MKDVETVKSPVNIDALPSGIYRQIEHGSHILCAEPLLEGAFSRAKKDPR